MVSNLKSMVSEKTALFTESVIRMMTQRCNRYQAVNLSQGTPAFPTPEKVKKAAIHETKTSGGQGVLREVVEWILHAQDCHGEVLEDMRKNIYKV